MAYAELWNANKCLYFIRFIWCGAAFFIAPLGIAQSSHFSTGKSRQGALIESGFDFSMGSTLSDFRPQSQLSSNEDFFRSPNPFPSPDPIADVGSPTVSIPPIKIHQSEVWLRSALSANADEPLHFQVGLHMSTVYSSDPEVLQSTEFDRLQVALAGQSEGQWGYELGFAFLRSPKNLLFEPHRKVSAHGYFMSLGQVDSVRAALKIGPEFVASSNPKENLYHYGFQWGLKGALNFELELPQNNGALRFGSGVLFRRSDSYQVAGVSLAGGGLLTISPELSYRLLDDAGLWIGTRWEQPLFRPAGNEAVFGDVSLPGLTGSALVFTLSVAAL